jgi:hypothetical protein
MSLKKTIVEKRGLMSAVILQVILALIVAGVSLIMGCTEAASILALDTPKSGTVDGGGIWGNGGLWVTPRLVLSIEETATLATTKTVTWVSGDPTIAAVDSGGVVTGKAVGKVVITATADGETATCTVTVADPVIPVTGLILKDAASGTIDTTSGTPITMYVGEPKTVYADVTPDNATDGTVTMVSGLNKLTVARSGTDPAAPWLDQAWTLRAGSTPGTAAISASVYGLPDQTFTVTVVKPTITLYWAWNEGDGTGDRIMKDGDTRSWSGTPPTGQYSQAKNKVVKADFSDAPPGYDYLQWSFNDPDNAALGITSDKTLKFSSGFAPYPNVVAPSTAILEHDTNKGPKRGQKVWVYNVDSKGARPTDSWLQVSAYFVLDATL